MSELQQKRICYLICVYNDPQGLDKSLSSIYADAPLADILIVDDGSVQPISVSGAPDNIHIHIERLASNQGLIAALNAGLRYILDQNYEYIARLDAGDTVNAGRLKAQTDYLNQNPDIGIVGTQIRAFDAISGQTLFHFNNPVEPQAVKKTLKIRNCLAHPSVMYRTDLIHRCGMYDPCYKYAEDYEMWRRMARITGVANLQQTYVNKEISPVQMTALNRGASTRSKLKAQFKYLHLLDIYCWAGIIRSLIALTIPRKILLHAKANKASPA